MSAPSTPQYPTTKASTPYSQHLTPIDTTSHHTHLTTQSSNNSYNSFSKGTTLISSTNIRDKYINNKPTPSRNQMLSLLILYFCLRIVAIIVLAIFSQIKTNRTNCIKPISMLLLMQVKAVAKRSQFKPSGGAKQAAPIRVQFAHGNPG